MQREYALLILVVVLFLVMLNETGKLHQIRAIIKGVYEFNSEKPGGE